MIRWKSILIYEILIYDIRTDPRYNSIFMRYWHASEIIIWCMRVSAYEDYYTILHLLSFTFAWSVYVSCLYSIEFHMQCISLYTDYICFHGNKKRQIMHLCSFFFNMIWILNALLLFYNKKQTSFIKWTCVSI